jgi:hypothetical protein
MDRSAVSSLVRDTLAGYRYEPPPTGSTLGVPRSAEKVYAYVEKLSAALVEPYLQRFELRESYEEVGQDEPSYAEFWVVAEGNGGYLEWAPGIPGPPACRRYSGVRGRRSGRGWCTRENGRC